MNLPLTGGPANIGSGTALLSALDISVRDPVQLELAGIRPISERDFINLLLAPTIDATYQGLVALLDDDTTATGSFGNDGIEVGAGNDTVTAGAGNDTVLKWKAGNLTYDGGEGNDWLKFSAATGVIFPTAPTQRLVVDLSTGTGQNPYGGTLTLTSVENVEGTAAADTIIGNDAANILGDDFAFGGGADIIEARGGNDVVTVSTNGINVRADGGAGIDELQIALPDNRLVPTTILDLQNPAANTGSAAGGVFSNFEIFSGKAIFAGASQFDFRGDGNAQVVNGSSQADLLRGRGGADRLNGGVGGDSYLYQAGDGNDIITDFGGANDVDVLRLEGLASAAVTLSRVANNLVVRITATGEIITIVDHFLGTSTGLEQIAFDGATLDRTQIAAAATADPNRAPSAANINVAIAPAAAFTFPILNAATDPDGDALSAIALGTAFRGRAFLNADGTVTYTPNGDTFGTDSFSYTVFDGKGGTAKGTVTVNIAAPPRPAVSIAAAEAAKAEGNGGPGIPTLLTFTLTRAGDLTRESTVEYAVTGSGANAAAAADFFGGTLPSDVVFFAAGEASKTIAIALAGDTANEANETFTVTLSTPFASTIGTATVTGTILNDDGPLPAIPELSVSLTPASAEEGAAFTLTLTRRGADLSQASSAGYAITGISADDIGVPLTGTLTIAAGQTSVTLAIPSVEDTTGEPDERFTVTLSAPVNATILTGTASATILNDDGTPPVNVITGTPGNDVLEGTSGNDDIQGLAGNDVLIGGAGADKMDGGAGNDIVWADVADTVLAGGTGYDYLVFADAANHTLALGSAGFETIIGNAGVDTFDLTGATSDLLLIAWGGAGNDTITLGASTGYAYGQDGDDLLKGAEGDAIDVLIGGNGADIMVGNGGNDLFWVDALDTVDGGAGIDWMIIESVAGATLSIGNFGVEVVAGNSGNDSIDASRNTLGLVIWGNAGADTLQGGRGNDHFYGGSDGTTDLFRFGANWGLDQIWDFEDGTDRISVREAGITSFAELTITTSGTVAIIGQAGTSNQIYVHGAAGNITAADFVF